jgi:hypothetical protein|tara:strand:+ start:6153 stop:6989 length:837 start_codon:yes stop_codon:yes gene_type:complete
MSFIFGSNSGGGGGSTSGTQVNIAREAPEVEGRKLALYDQAAKLAAQPVSLPGIQVAPTTALEQAAFQQAGQTGVGSATTTAGIGAVLPATQAPNISQFFNPYESYVTDEINRQAQIAQNTLSANAVASGAFGGGRQGIASAELERARLGSIGQARAQGFQTALGAAQQQQATGLQAGQLLGALGAQQQQMGMMDIQSQLQAGAVQRGIGQTGLEAQRQTQLQRAYEPFQRIEFLKGIMTNLPTTQSSITATTAPGANPLSQALGAGLGAYSAYQLTR